METYSLLREFADSWVLLLMTAFFLGVIVWAFRPGSREIHDDISQIPFRDELPKTEGSGNPSDKVEIDNLNTIPEGKK